MQASLPLRPLLLLAVAAVLAVCAGPLSGMGMALAAEASAADARVSPGDADVDAAGGLLPSVAPPTFGWVVAWAVLAVLTLVVGTSMTRPRPIQVDPLLPQQSTGGGGAPGILRPAVEEEAVSEEAGRALAYRAAPRTVEDALRLMESVGLGKAQLLREEGGVHVVSISRGQSSGKSGKRFGGKGSPAACRFEASFIRGAFENVLGRDVTVEETRCARRTGGACEFRVR